MRDWNAKEEHNTSYDVMAVEEGGGRRNKTLDAGDKRACRLQIGPRILLFCLPCRALAPSGWLKSKYGTFLT